GCFGGKGEPEKVVRKDTKPAANTSTVKVQPVPIAPVPPPPDPCKVFEKISGEPPVFIEEHAVMVTRFMKPCVTRDGRRGYESNTPWIAMGFPCTAGGGKIQVTGYQSAPKLVSFPLSTDCPMRPATAKDVDAAVKVAIGLPPEAKIMA